MLLLLFLVGLASANYEDNYFNASEYHWSPLQGDGYEGDILLRDGENPNDRGAMGTRYNLWPGRQVYYIFKQNDYSEYDRNLIRKGIEEFHRYTCIRFTEGRGNGNYISIENSKGCYSFIGMSGGQQTVNLIANGCLSTNTIVHELLHALGFWHEQNRPDQDNYIIMHWDNIEEDFKYAFDKKNTVEVNSLGEPYDFRSVMHYNAWGFAIDSRKPAISPRDPNIPLSALGAGGNGRSFTDSDIRGLHKLYSCPLP